MSWSRSVYSSTVSDVAYDSDRGEMVVTWKTGRVSVYSGVPEAVAEQASKAPSVGQFLNMQVKPHYEHSYR